MSILYSVIKRFLFWLDAETAHHLVLRFLAWLSDKPRFRSLASWAFSASTKPQSTSQMSFIWNLSFSSPLGLAAGFDKNAEFVPMAARMGFGFVEIGTVTPRAQPGNERPRLFREIEKENLFNRMGFNNLGATLVAQNLKKAKLQGDLPIHFRVGVNIGKNKDTQSEHASLDYALAIEPFESLADYVVINVSSPNTPGLRDLQNIDSLHKIFDAVTSKTARWSVSPPVLFKLAPEIEGESLQKIISQGDSWGVSGWVLTNTWGGQWRLGSGEALTGGWSGDLLKKISRDRLVQARAFTKNPIISVGGIMDSLEACDRIQKGANLIQVYSGWVYRGPTLVSDINKAILGSVS